MTDATLLLIHGLGASGGVWSGVQEELAWPGRVVVPELPGHGAAPWTGDYSLGAMAAAVASELEPGEPVVAAGHSLGGVVALCLASGFFRPAVQAVVGVGLKIVWTDDDLAGMAKVAAKGVRHFDTRDEAATRFLRQAGLDGLVPLDHPATETGVVADGDRWRAAQDPLTFAQRPVPMAALMAAAHCPVLLGAGEHDAMVSADDLAVHVDDPRIAAGRGHNAPVEDPAWFAQLVMEAASLAR
ncbi:MAG: alpha/beta hydrolase [Actinomycetota bacterium]